MKRLSALTVSTLAAGAAIVAFAALPARSETIYYNFPALPGRDANCQRYGDNISHRSTASLIRQTDLIHNRLALVPNSTLTVTGSATTQKGAHSVQFDVAG